MQPITGMGHPHAVESSLSQNEKAPDKSFSAALSDAMSRPAGAAPQPAHVQTGGAGHGKNAHDFQAMVLGIRAYRQELIASNIANADTPGYKAVDIDFQEALRIARSSMTPLPVSLTVTATGHISAQAPAAETRYPIRYHVPVQASADGNTVEMDVERAKFAENAMMWEFSRDRVSGHFKHMMEMLQNLKD